MTKLLPVTLATASFLSLVYLVLVFRVGQVRRRARISIGDGGNEELRMRMRTQANFIEYVPQLLVLMALLESAGANPTALACFGTLLIVLRVLHAFGMPRPAPNAYRAIGAGGTILMVLALAIWGIVIIVTS